METLHYFLTFLLLLSGACIFISNNPVYSVLFLILNFCIAAIILFILEIEFLGLLFIMVYVGAVAVLFLFVVMMINTKKTIPRRLSITSYFIIILLMSISYIKLNFIFNDVFFNSTDENVILSSFNSSLQNLDKLSNIEVIGQSLYNNYNVAVLLAGFILLIALVGCVCLTVNFKSNKNIDKSYKQLSKGSNCVHKFQ